MEDEFDTALLHALHPSEKTHDSLLYWLRHGTYMQVSRLLKVDGSLYVFLHEDFQNSAELAKLALQGGMSISRVNRKLLGEIEFYKDNYDFIHRDNNWIDVYYYLPQEVQRTESIMLAAILHSVNIIPLINLCHPCYVVQIKESSWIKINAIPKSQQLSILWHVVPNVKRHIAPYYESTLAANVLLRCWKKCALSDLPLDVMRNITTYLISENYSEMRRAMRNLADVQFPRGWNVENC